MMRITPNNITSLQKGEVFVFGSNEAGIHGAGAAKIASRIFGATFGQGFGYSEITHRRNKDKILQRVASFAIPTKGWDLEILDKERISFYVERFIDFADRRPHLKFLVTEIGCGLAGYEPKDIAPMFYFAKDLENVYLPERFWDVINDMK